MTEWNGAEKLSVLLLRCGQKLRGGEQRTQGRILKILYLNGPMTQKVLQDKLEIQPGSMSELVSKLERKGLLLREKDPADKRKILLTLTEAGRADVEQFRAHGHATRGRTYGALTEAEQATLCELLEKLLDSWE